MTREEFDAGLAELIVATRFNRPGRAAEICNQLSDAFAALRPLKPIAERVLAALAAQCYDGSYDERPIMELRKALDDLAAQEDGEK